MRSQLDFVGFVDYICFMQKKKVFVILGMASVVRELAVEFDALLLPYDDMFERLIQTQPAPSYWLWDGIHPTAAGHRRMANLWKKKVKL